MFKVRFLAEELCVAIALVLRALFDELQALISLNSPAACGPNAHLVSGRALVGLFGCLRAAQLIASKLTPDRYIRCCVPSSTLYSE